jgi:hypothetical protein
MPVRYEPNPFYEVGIEAQERYISGRYSIAKDIARLAKLFAPVRDSKYKRRLLPGVYRRRIRATPEGVEVPDPFRHWIEFGSVHNAPKAPVRRAVRAAGLRLVVFPKHR